MSQWAQVQRLAPEYVRSVQGIYGQHFPLEIRHHLAEFLELQAWNELQDDDPSCFQYACQLLQTTIQKLEELSENLLASGESFLLKITLQTAADNFKQRYGDDPLSFIRVIKDCLAKEQTLIQQAENLVHKMEEEFVNPVNEVHNQIEETLKIINVKVEEGNAVLKKMQQTQEDFMIDFQNFQLLQNQQRVNAEKVVQVKVLVDAGKLTPEQIQLYQNLVELEKKQRKSIEEQQQKNTTIAIDIKNSRNIIIGVFKENFTMLADVQKMVLEGELSQWKRQQQLAGNGAEFDADFLNTIQKWVETLACLIWKTRQDIRNLEELRNKLKIPQPQGIPDEVPELVNNVTGLLSNLVTSTFIVESQPPQVLKKEARFSASVRLLVGGQLNIHMTPPKVTANIISESQAKCLMNNEGVQPQDSVGQILNNTGHMEYHQNTGILNITFRNMKLNMIKRTEKRGLEQAVTEEKSCIMFQSDFQIGNEMVFQVWTLSLPVVVIVHGNQECNAMATILWDNHFAETERVPFTVPDVVPWPKVAEMLDCKFKAMTGRGLSLENTNYLASKILGTELDYSQTMCSWQMFYKDTLPGRNFSFWEWTYGVMKLLKECLKNYWMDGSILGFVGKSQAQEMLSQKANGTFLLRFSDSETGGVTIAWIAEEPNNPGSGKREVWNLCPYLAKDFHIRCLSDRIKDLLALVYLYPNIPKDQAFGKYYKSTKDTEKISNGYVKPELIESLPAAAACMSHHIMDPASPHTPDPLPTSQQGVKSEMLDIEFDDIIEKLGEYTSDDMQLSSGSLTEYLQNL